MRRTLLVIAALGLLFGAFYLTQAVQFRRGTMAQPGPGLYPILVGVLLLAGSLGTGLGAAASKLRDEIDWPKGEERLRVLVMLAATAGYVLLLPYLGHMVAGTLVMVVVLQVMGLTNWPLKIGMAAALGLGSYYIFVRLLGVPLPAGTWFG